MIELTYQFPLDSATITSSSEASGCPDDNVVDDRLGAVWRTTGDNSEWIEFYVSPYGEISRVGIFGHNLTDSAVLTLKYGNTTPPTNDAGGTWHLSKSKASGGEGNVIWLGSIVWGAWNPYIRLIIEDPTNPDGYIQIGRICAGKPIALSANFRCGAERRQIDPSERLQSKGQDSYSYEKDKFWLYNLPFDVIETADKNLIRAMYRALGETRPLMVTLDSTNEPNISTIYGRLASDYREDWQSPVPTYGTRIEVEEIV